MALIYYNTKNENEKILCPKCKKRMGKIGMNSFACTDCSIEMFIGRNGKIKLFKILENGKAVNMKLVNS